MTRIPCFSRFGGYAFNIQNSTFLTTLSSMSTGVISLLDQHLPERCAEIIRRGELIIFPTETIYGIGGSALDERAWEGLRQLKPDRTKPFTYLVADWEMAAGLIGGDIDRIRIVADRVFPGPVTLIVTSSEKFPVRLRNSDGSIGLRAPCIDRIREAIAASGVPWVHTSANLSGGKGVRNLRTLDTAVRSKARLTIDGRTTALGGESTVIDLRQFPFRILRSGVLPEARIRDLLA